MPKAVVNGAILTCTCGSLPMPLQVTSQTAVSIDGQLAATIMDFAPTTNIKPFGICATLTAAAMGTPTPCVPATVAPWITGSTTGILISSFLALRNTDTLPCTVGGTISVTSPGQVTTTDT